MEKQIRGGYILVSLGLIALSTSYSGSIDYDRISRTKKHIVLTGIKIASTVMPDITVKPIYGNGTITFEDVYGFDIVISSNNSVSVSEHVAPSSGIKLYRHVYSFGPTSFIIISTKSTQLTNEDDNKVLSGRGGVLVESAPVDAVLCKLSGGGPNITLYVLTASGDVTVDITSITPTITEIN